jgi:DNA-directed RNA polymerase specialized sigma24 family protein
VGMTLPEAAAVMDINVETAKKRWRVIKALLMSRLEGWNSRGD